MKHLINKIRDFALNPKEAQDNIKLLKEGLQGHHYEMKAMKFRKEQDEIAILDTETTRWTSEYFAKVLNRNAEEDIEYLHQMLRKAVLFELANPISLIEFNQTANKITQHKSLGINGALPNIIKTLDDENKFALCLFIKDQIEDSAITHEQ